MRSVGDVLGRIGGGQLYPCGLVCLSACLSLFGFFCCGIFSPSGNGSS